MRCSHQKMEAQRSLDVEKAIRLDGSQLQIFYITESNFPQHCIYID